MRRSGRRWIQSSYAACALFVFVELVAFVPAAHAADPLPDLNITKSGPDTMQAGNTYTYHLGVGNPQSGTRATNVTMRDELPAGVSFLSASSDAGGFNCSHNAGVVTCTGVGPIHPHGGGAIQINVRAPSLGGTITNRAVVDPDNSITEENEANNTSNPVTTTVIGPTDSTPPVITPNISGTQGDNGWYTSDVTVSWTVTDGESQITSQSGCATTTITQDTASTTLTCQATSAGGTRSESVTIKRDATAPTITDDEPTAPPDGENGWYTSEVTNTFSASDGPNGSGLADPTQASFTRSSGDEEGGGVKISSGPVSDVAGNTNAGIESAAFDIDRTSPTISASLDKNPDATTGWFNAATGAPTVSFQCDDPTPGSGLAVGACPSGHTFDNGADQSHSGTVSDIAGNQASDEVSDVDVDLMPPTKPVATTNPANPVEGSGGWFKDEVSVSYSGSTDEGGSGLADPAYSLDDVFDTSGEHTYSGFAKDNAGNRSEPATGSLKVDAEAPTLAISGCPTTPVSLNSSQSINVTAGDGHSGLAEDSSGTLTLDTSSAGSHAETVTATDKVGHSKSATCSYSVTYNFSGFFSPVDNLPTLNSVKGGAAIPVKFSLSGDQGLEIFEAGYPKSQQIQCDSTAPVDGIEQTVTANTSGLTYDASTGHYSYVWKSSKGWAGTCRQFVMKLEDGSIHLANFKFKEKRTVRAGVSRPGPFCAPDPHGSGVFTATSSETLDAALDLGDDVTHSVDTPIR